MSGQIAGGGFTIKPGEAVSLDRVNQIVEMQAEEIIALRAQIARLESGRESRDKLECRFELAAEITGKVAGIANGSLILDSDTWFKVFSYAVDRLELGHEVE